jgi:peptidoglycan biosynthesis protein MviN/MurJ (putative lipid II flippase)
MGITGAVNLLLDWLLIPHYGAVGAAWGNGLGQAFGVVAIWMQARRFYRFGLPLGPTLRLFAAAGVMAAAAYEVAHHLHGKTALVASISVAIPLYILLVKLFHGLEASDRVRLSPIGNRLPGPFRRAFTATLDFLTPVPQA